MSRSTEIITHRSLLITLWATTVANGQILINEIEYDQVGADSAEFIELFEPDRTGMSLAGWQLILYDGLASRRWPYRTINLSQAPGGVMPADGYLVIGTSPAVANVDIAQAANWIENGEPDGMALVHNGVVIERLAYEGTFDANTNGTGGPAAGMNFPDIGVAEEPSDNGLQRRPDGGVWTVTDAAAASPGRRNPNGPALFPIGRLMPMHRGDADSGPIPLCVWGGVPAYTLTITALPAFGQLSHSGGVITGTPTPITGDLRYTPNAGFSGLDQFSFRARDSVSTISNSVVQEVAVQAGGVVISEVMHSPSADWRVYSYVEIHNPSAAAVQLGRLDGSRSNVTNTTANLLGDSIPAGETRIIAADASAIGADAEAFRCEWDLREQDIIRIPLAAFETMFSAPDGAECSASEGSRLLLFDAANNLLDAVDLALIGLPGAALGQSLTIHDGFLVPAGPLDTRNNDVANPWFNAGTSGVPGVHVAQSGDRGSPMIVPSLANPFMTCLTGPGGGVAQGCGPWNEDADSDVDLRDFAVFQAVFVGSSCP